MYSPPQLPKYTAQQFCVIASGNPFTVNWVPITQNFYMGQSHIFDSGTAIQVPWWIFQAIPRGQVFAREPPSLSKEFTDPLCAAALNGLEASMLKVELQYVLGNAMVRTIRFDIGTGRVLLIPPTYNIQATILVPEPLDSEIPPPDPFDPDLFVIERLVLAAICVQDPETVGTDDLTFTTPFVISDPAVFEVRVPVEPGAVEVEVCFDQPPANNLEFIMERRDIDGNLIDEVIISTVSLANPTDTCFPRVHIPANANIIRYFEIIPPPGIRGTVTQFLEFS